MTITTAYTKNLTDPEPAKLFRQWYAGFVNCAGAWSRCD